MEWTVGEKEKRNRKQYVMAVEVDGGMGHCGFAARTELAKATCRTMGRMLNELKFEQDCTRASDVHLA